MDSSPAEVLTAAADLLEKLLADPDLTPGPWQILLVPPYTDPLLLGDAGEEYVTGGTIDCGEATNAWIKAMSPTVGRPIVEWLRSVAEEYATLAGSPYGPAAQSFVAGDAGGSPDPALVVARAILAGGTDA